MAFYTYYIKAGTYAASAYPAIVNGLVCALNDVVRGGNSQFWLCTTAGTASSSTLNVDGTDPDAYVANGTAVFRLVSGEDGAVANTWNIAAESLTHATPVGSVQLSGMPKNGRMYKDTNSPLVYFDKTVAISLPADGWFLQQMGNITESGGYNGLGLYYSYIKADTRATLVSAASGIYPAVYSKGAQWNISGFRITLVGILGFKGFEFNCNSGILQLSHSYLGDTVYWSNCRLFSDNKFDDCDFNLLWTAGGVLIPAIVIGLQNEATTYPQANYVLSRGAGGLYSEFDACNFRIDHNLAKIVILCDTKFTGCTFYNSYGYMPTNGFLGLSRYAREEAHGGISPAANFGGQVNDIAVQFTSCVFQTKMTYLVAPKILGRVRLTFIGCEFPAGFSIERCLDNVSMSTSADLALEFYGCGETGNMDSDSHVYVTPRVACSKSRAVFRADALLDHGGSKFSYYVKTKGGLRDYTFAEELIKISTDVPAGLVKVALYVAFPPGVAPTDRSLFAFFVFPDRGGNDYTNDTTYKDTEDVANFVSTRPGDFDIPATTIASVTSAWTGLPSGWNVFKVEATAMVSKSGRVLCIPRIAVNNTEAYVCPTLEVRRV